MPFTPSHAVVALPFIRTPLIPAAIAIGAMTPDLPLFLRGTPVRYAVTHDLAWMPLTIALVLLVIWRAVLRPAARELVPMGLARRLPGEWDAGAAAALRETFAIAGTPPRASWRGILLLLVSLAIGIASHVVWDLFTHEDRWGVEVLPVLDELWGPLSGYRWLQHGSSVLGLAVLGIWAVLWVRRRDATSCVRVLPSPLRWAWWLSLPTILILAWTAGLAISGPITAEWTIPHLAYRVLPPACALWAVLTAGLAVAVQVLRARRSVPAG
ncbi:protein of unknown function [Microbacterium sp. cf046]|uniref:DUF4184 family protein n=1 Tax=Microbacterium sp. cf046 TaxID=1761803 RepID=UPI0008F04AA8|nr:DUF4184 family protein [Microbacterium sp. cf046]SFS02077.1 protein of unknown function [Microbacterium sp. cf046]